MNHFEGKSWELYTIIALVLVIINVVAKKHLFNLKCSFYDVIFFYAFFLIVFYSLFLIFLYNKKKDILFKDKKNFKTILFFTFIASFTIGMGVLYKTKAYELVSNMSYVDALMEPSKIILLYLFSIMVFGTMFKPIISLGILLALTGIIIILKNQ
jgi:hypothetical protein